MPPPVAFYNIKIASRDKSIEKSVVHDLERKQKDSKVAAARRLRKTISPSLSLRNLFFLLQKRRGKQISSMEDELLLDLRPLDFIKTPGAHRRVIESRGGHKLN